MILLKAAVTPPFQGEEHPRAPAGGQGEFSGGEFVPKQFENEFLLGPKGLEILQRAVEGLNKTASKLGLLPMAVEVVGTERKPDPNDAKVIRELMKVRVTGPRPVLAGHRLLGIIQHKSPANILRAMPGETIPEKYRRVKSKCDHCKTERSRNDTCVVQHDTTGKTVQLGKNCLRDYLGHADPLALAGMLESYQDAVERAEGAEDDEERWSGGAGRGRTLLDSAEFLSNVAAVIRKHGWMSVTKARDVDTFSSVARALNNLDPPKDWTVVDVRASDKKMAAAAVKWLRKQPASWADNDYLRNVKVMAEQDAVQGRDLGLLASIIALYQRENALTPERKRQAVAAAASEHQGAIGDRINRRVTILKVIPYETDYGQSYITEMEDDAGHRYKWFGAGTGRAVGSAIDIDGTVKSHGEWNGVKETVLTRCKVLTTPEEINDYYDLHHRLTKLEAKFIDPDDPYRRVKPGADKAAYEQARGKIQEMAERLEELGRRVGHDPWKPFTEEERNAKLAALEKRGKKVRKSFGIRIRKSQMSMFHETEHPRAPVGGAGKYEGGEFVPKGHAGGKLAAGLPHPQGHASSTAEQREIIKERGLPPIPPASWGLWVNPDPHAKLQATWYDAKGRKQPRYSAEHVAASTDKKFAKLAVVGRAMPALRKKVKKDLKLQDATKERVAAAIVSIIDATTMRVGSEQFAVREPEEASYGASSLRKEHVTVKGKKVRFNFPGKHGKQWDRELADPNVAAVISHLMTLPGDRLFQFRLPSGRLAQFDESQVNDYLRPFGITAKSFRTYHATIMAAERLAAAGPPADDKAAIRTITRVCKEVANHLGNTPAVCRSSYIAPEVFAVYKAGKLTTEMFKAVGAEQFPTPEELAERDRRALRLIEQIEQMVRRGEIEPDHDPYPEVDLEEGEEMQKAHGRVSKAVCLVRVATQDGRAILKAAPPAAGQGVLFDPEKHPRAAAGSEHGGEFVAAKAAPSIKRIINVEDTRQYEEGPDDRWYPIPGSGSARQCDRCGRIHEVHAEVELSDGSRAIVGTGCMGKDDAEVASRFQRADRAAKRIASLTAKLKKDEDYRARYDAAMRHVEALPHPEIELTDEPMWEGSTRKRAKMGDVHTAYLNSLERHTRESLTHIWRERRIQDAGFTQRPASDGALSELRKEIRKVQSRLDIVASGGKVLTKKEQLLHDAQEKANRLAAAAAVHPDTLRRLHGAQQAGLDRNLRDRVAGARDVVVVLQRGDGIGVVGIPWKFGDHGWTITTGMHELRTEHGWINPHQLNPMEVVPFVTALRASGQPVVLANSTADLQEKLKAVMTVVPPDQRDTDSRAWMVKPEERPNLLAPLHKSLPMRLSKGILFYRQPRAPVGGEGRYRGGEYIPRIDLRDGEYRSQYASRPAYKRQRSQWYAWVNGKWELCHDTHPNRAQNSGWLEHERMAGELRREIAKAWDAADHPHAPAGGQGYYTGGEFVPHAAAGGLFGDDEPAARATKPAPHPLHATYPANGSVHEIPMSEIEPDWSQDRSRDEFSPVKIGELAESMKRGLDQPIIVRPQHGEGQPAFQIIAGERRYTAAKMLGWEKVRAQVRNVTDREAADIQLRENVSRKDLTPMDEAKGFQSRIDRFGMTPEDLSSVTGKSVAYVQNRIALNNLTGGWQTLLQAGNINITWAVMIAKLAKPSQDALLSELTRWPEDRWTTTNVRLAVQERARAESQQAWDFKDGPLDDLEHDETVAAGKIDKERQAAAKEKGERLILQLGKLLDEFEQDDLGKILPLATAHKLSGMIEIMQRQHDGLGTVLANLKAAKASRDTTGNFGRYIKNAGIKATSAEIQSRVSGKVGELQKQISNARRRLARVDANLAALHRQRGVEEKREDLRHLRKQLEMQIDRWESDKSKVRSVLRKAVAIGMLCEDREEVVARVTMFKSIHGILACPAWEEKARGGAAKDSNALTLR